MSELTSLFSLVGRRALVTGGATGVGYMIARGLAMAGAEVMIASRKAESCRAAAARIAGDGLAGSVSGFGGDVATEQGIADLVEEVGARTDRLDILVNNAGVSWGAPIETFPHEQWARVMGVNVAGMFTLTRSLLPLLRAAASAENPARILNIGSVMGSVPVTEGAYSYTMSKAAVHHMTKVFAAEFAPDHITANALAPGPFPSKMTAFATGTPEGAERVGRNVPLGRIGRESDLAGAAIFLCSAAGAYVSGAILPLDGGMSVATPVDLFANTL
ncbi:SDR family oxidoreductase [Oceanibium sediminis]|uniref:SDR family oxidoreductase n=1 Tax=Oceanibium sediminis TaxID=2026339 RepID=UPI000DD47A72|nr:SDR family oxidoreductase [Oceanibium sediminis]